MTISHIFFRWVVALGIALAQTKPAILAQSMSDRCVTVNETATGNCLWKLGLATDTDQLVLGMTISYYRIRWSNGWSEPYYPGGNDIDGTLTDGGSCNGVPYAAGKQRRQWSYFVDHYHSYTRGSTVRPTNICNKATRRWEALECGFGLFWNPDWNANITGGSCDEWDNLAAEIQNRYNSDAACFPPCYYEKNGECSNNYIYHPAGSDHRVSQTLECPSNLVWADEMQTCDRCDHVMDDVKGVNCCGSISEPGNGGGGGGPI
ncbi:hypothetical protein Fcan01_23962 [Folsomia candida]|uniref:Uncharacterized protein n=1 Tax=Folsomia candida TaxID=158441 RepID=A0A226D6Y5_FOLCA|nr:hypothetical protein Fcan01_23962 [Folsomia candida]